MKLVHVDLDTKLLDDNVITEWIIESPEEFTRYVQEFYLQCEGEEGGFTLSEGEKELNISIVAIGIPKERKVSRLYFTPTFSFSGSHAAAIR